MSEKNDAVVIEKSPSPSLLFEKKMKKNDVAFTASPILLSSSSSSSETESTGTPIRQIACLKNADDLKRFEETEDCFILEFDPVKPVNLISLFDHDGDAPEISLVAEKGQVACRDYPHSRHLCLKFPFETTTHESHCDMCYCYVCDSPAPCSRWNDPTTGHCHATEQIGSWKLLRSVSRAIPSQH